MYPRCAFFHRPHSYSRSGRCRWQRAKFMDGHEAHSRSPLAADRGMEVRSPICPATERGAWGEGERRVKPSMKSRRHGLKTQKHRARLHRARSAAAALPARKPDTVTDALAPRRGRTPHPLACSCAQIVPVTVPALPAPRPTQSNSHQQTGNTEAAIIPPP